MGVTKIDERGRVVIPSRERKLLGLQPGDILEVEVREGVIVLRPRMPKPFKVRAGRTWGSEAFLKAGEATFGD